MMRGALPVWPGRSLRRLARGWLAATLAVALLLVQQAGWQHGLAHDAAQARSFSSVARLPHIDAGGGHEAGHTNCTLCLAFAQAAWAAPALPTVVPLPRVVAGPPALAWSVPAIARPQRSAPIRGPPAGA